MATLPVKQLDFGRRDARAELNPKDNRSKRMFTETFVHTAGFSSKEFEEGRRTIIVGMKGSGKTALQIFLRNQMYQSGWRTLSIIFSDEMTSDERAEFSRSAGFTLVEQSAAQSVSAITQDFEVQWRWFFHRQFQKLAREKGVWSRVSQRYRTLMEALTEETNPKSIWARFLPSTSKSKINLGANFGLLKAEFATDFEFSEKDRQVSLSVHDAVRILDYEISSVFSALERSVLFVDEINLSNLAADQYTRDCRIVRDLIVTARRYNLLAGTSGFPFRVIISVRQEVLSAVESLGKELNKIVGDFAHTLHWHGPQEGFMHPLFQIISKKVRFVEEEMGLREDNSIFTRYFPTQVNNLEFSKYIINKTWYRPRDFVRFFDIARTMAITENENAVRFSRNILKRANKEYSRESWREIKEELQATINTEQISGLEQVLGSLGSDFTIDDFLKRMIFLSDRIRHVARLKELEVAELFTILFRLGVIGNEVKSRTRNIQIWSYRGEAVPRMDAKFVLHRGLRDNFSHE